MTTKIQGFQFQLTAVESGPVYFQTKQNVKKRFANIIYSAAPPTDSINLEYVGSKESIPTNSIFIADRSDDLYANSRNNTVKEFFGYKDASEIPVANKNFLATQEFVDSTNGKIPLYYKHWLPSTVLQKSIRLFDKNYNEIGTNRYKVVIEYEYNEDTGQPTTTINNLYVFNSLESSYDVNSGEYEVFFIQYTTRVGTTEETITELLDNEFAYTLATAEDMLPSMVGTLKPWARSYLLHGDYGDAMSSYYITLPKTSRYAIRYIESNRVSIKHPVDFSDEGPWFPRVVNGGFVSGLGDVLSKYDIREFSNQSFNPIEPYKLAGHVKCIKIDTNLIKLPNEGIVSGILFSPLYILIEDTSGPIYAITDDSDQEGTIVYDSDGNRVLDSNGNVLTWSTSLFLGIDSLSGIVHVDLKILDSYKIYGTYTYTEYYYSLSGLPMNPVFDSTTTEHIRVVYLVPRNGPNNNSSTQTASVKYLYVLPNGKISYCNQNGTNYNPAIDFDTEITTSDGYAIHGIYGLHYSWSGTAISNKTNSISASGSIGVTTTVGFPKTGWLRARTGTEQKYRYFRYIDKTTTSFILSDESTEIPSTIDTIASGENIYLVNFVDELTIQTSRNLDDELAYGGNVYSDLGNIIRYPSIYAQYFILGELSINPPHGISDLTRIDVRQNGGGIIPSKYNDAKKINAETTWLNDFCTFDGQIYPGDAVIVIKLPYSLLEDFNLEEIRGIVTENVPAGSYPLIRFYGYFARNVIVTPSVNSITIQWDKEGSEFVYDIWYSRFKDGMFTRLNTVRIVDSGSGNTNTFTADMIGGANYIFKITLRDKYYMWWYGYNGGTSIQGGLGLSETSPVPPFGNIANFQFQVT
jgi:hypothetical protein